MLGCSLSTQAFNGKNAFSPLRENNFINFYGSDANSSIAEIPLNCTIEAKLATAVSDEPFSSVSTQLSKCFPINIYRASNSRRAPIDAQQQDNDGTQYRLIHTRTGTQTDIVRQA